MRFESYILWLVNNFPIDRLEFLGKEISSCVNNSNCLQPCLFVIHPLNAFMQFIAAQTKILMWTYPSSDNQLWTVHYNAKYIFEFPQVAENQ
jgi:hypothetical protein